MTAWLIVVLLLGAGLMVFSGLRTSRKVKSLNDFFSFGEFSDPVHLQRAFTVTNASFTTSFVTLFFLGLTLGIVSFAIPLGFVLGILSYVFIFLPRQINHLERDVRYPQLLGELTGSQKTRKIVSLFVVFSLFLFTFAEFQGLQLFLSALLVSVPSVRELMPPLLVVLIAWYTARSGYRAIIGNDLIQFALIIIGTVCIFLLWALSTYSIGITKILDTSRQLHATLHSSDIWKFIAQAGFGFVFSQLIYYDNWQRLTFYMGGRRLATSMEDSSVVLKKVEKEIRNNYLIGAVYLLIIYAAPIIMSLQVLSTGNATPSFETLAVYFQNAWSSTHIVGISIGPFLVIGSILFMLSALVSTAEVYIVGLVNSVIEDILGYKHSDSKTESDQLDALKKTRFVVAMSCLFLIPLLFVEPDFTKLFDFMFYSANGFVGPVLCALFGRSSTSWQVALSLVFGILYSLPGLLSLPHAEYFQIPGVVVVAASILICLPMSKKSKCRG